MGRGRLSCACILPSFLPVEEGRVCRRFLQALNSSAWHILCLLRAVCSSALCSCQTQSKCSPRSEQSWSRGRTQTELFCPRLCYKCPEEFEVFPLSLPFSLRTSCSPCCPCVISLCSVLVPVSVRLAEGAAPWDEGSVGLQSCDHIVQKAQNCCCDFGSTVTPPADNGDKDDRKGFLFQGSYPASGAFSCISC